MKKYILLIICITFLLKIQAQHFGFQFSENFAFHTNGLNIIIKYSKQNKKSNDNIYLYKDALPGNIKLFGEGELISGVHIKYNVFNNLVEIVKGDTLYTIANEEILFFKIQVNDKTESYINSSVLKNSELEHCFLRVLAYGDLILMKQTEMFIQEPMGQHYGANIQTKKFIKKKRYFFLNNNEIKQFKFGKKAILEILKDKKVEVTEYARNNKLSYKKEEDVISLFSYFNELQKKMLLNNFD